MPREQVEWFVKQSTHEIENDQAHQSCTYYSTVNVDKSNYPYSSSFEQEQTWTLTRTMSQQNKRYQTSIENIRLTAPPIVTIVAPLISNKNDKIKIDRSISLRPSSSRQQTSSSSSSSLFHRFDRNDKDFEFSSQEKSKVSVITNPMRIMHTNGEFVVRI